MVNVEAKDFTEVLAVSSRPQLVRPISKLVMKMIRLILIALLFILGVTLDSNAQTTGKKRLDLDDLMIKGQLLNDERLLILSRQKNELKNFVKFRTHFRNEILQQLPEQKSRQKF